MKRISEELAALSQPTPQDLVLSGSWTARGISALEIQLESVRGVPGATGMADAARIDALDTAGAWVLHELVQRLRSDGTELHGLRPQFARLFDALAQRRTVQAEHPDPPVTTPPPLARRHRPPHCRGVRTSDCAAQFRR